MKSNSALSAACFLALTALPSLAETFTLNDGTKLEGTIISEAADAYVVEVQVTKSIKDERKIAKSEIAKIDREQPDLKAFEAIAKLSPSPDLLTSEEYAVNIAAVEKFLKDHRSSDKTKAAKAILDTLKAEAAQISAGGIKLNGKMVSPADYKANAYDLDARVQEAKIRTLVDSEQYLAALRSFSEFDREYRTTLAYGALAPLMRQVIAAHVAETKQSLLTFDARTKERALGLQRMASEDRKATEEAIKEESAAVEARYKAEKDGKTPWPTTSPFHKPSLDDTVKFGETELTRLAAVKTVLGVDGGKAYREAYTAVNNGSSASVVTAAIAAAKAASVSPVYLAPLEASAKGRK